MALSESKPAVIPRTHYSQNTCLPACNGIRTHAPCAVCVRVATSCNGSCVLMPSRDFLWSSLPILSAGINPDWEPLAMKCEILGTAAESQRPVLKTYCSASAKRAEKTQLYSGCTVETHHEGWETPGACRLPPDKMR